MAEVAATIALLDYCQNFFGPLPEHVKQRLKAVLKNPTQETWDKAFCIILNPNKGTGLTLWEAVLAVDPTVPPARPIRRPRRQSPHSVAAGP
jgi:hypothetical protein